MNSSEDNIVLKNESWWNRRTTLERRLIIALAVVGTVAFSIFAVYIMSLRSKRSIEPEEDEYDVCLTPGCLEAATNVLNYIDLEVDPCEDFYQFSCGGFLKETPIPDDKISISTSDVISDAVEHQLRIIVEKPVQPKELKPFKLLKKLYSICMNTTANEIEDLELFKNFILKKLGGWPVLERKYNDKLFEWKNFSYEQRKLGFSLHTFMSIIIDVDNKNSSKYMLSLGEASLAFGRDDLIKGLENELVRSYYEYMVDVAVILGANRTSAKRQLLESLDFVVELAKISMPNEDYRNLTALYNPMTINELQRKFPAIPWLEYIRRVINVPGLIISSNDVINVEDPKYIRKLITLLDRTSKRAQANYAVYKVINSAIPYLTQELKNRQQELFNKIYGTSERESRWKECLSDVTGMFHVALGALYIRNYFNEDAKDNIVEIVTDIHMELNNTIQETEWMDDNTKEKALEKAESMTFHVAYTDELNDDKKIEEYYSKVEIDSDNYLTFALKMRIFEIEYMYSKVSKPVDKADWILHIPPMMVNAVYFPHKNSIDLPAGILQGVFFDNDRPRYMNYGGIGYVIGHEMTHGFDDMGRKYDKNGNVEDWWEKNTEKAFINKAKCIINQYAKIEVPEIKTKLNGVNTQGENIADNGGIKLAYNAYQAWVERNGPEPVLPGMNFTQNQMFWIAAANCWCQKTRRELLKQAVAESSHSPAKYRVIVPFSNTELFATDFNCPQGSKMNPEKKCQVW